jgi:hypothetical protein
MRVSANPLQNAAGRVLMNLSSYSAMGKQGRGGEGRPADADRCPCGKDSEGYDGALQGGEKRCAVDPPCSWYHGETGTGGCVNPHLISNNPQNESTPLF